MQLSRIEAWIDQVVIQKPPQDFSFTRKRTHSDFCIALGVSSPPPSMDPASEPDLEATPRPVLPSKRPRLDPAVPFNLRYSNSAPGDISPSPTRSTNTSTTGGRSNKSRSPVKDMADLALAEKPVEQVTHLKKEEEYPTDVRHLLRRIREVRRGIGIVPRPMVEKVQRSLNMMEDLDDHNAYDTNLWAFQDARAPGKDIDWDIDFELKTLEKVMARTHTCISENVSEHAWNARVHEPLLDVALAPFEGVVSHWDVTKAAIEKGYVPRHGSGIDLEAKMVDFCLTLDGQDTIRSVKERLRPGSHKSINHTDYQPLRFRPIAVSIETKTPDGSSQQAKAQLSVWTTAYIRRLRALAGTSQTAAGLGITLPVITVRGGVWELFFMVDRADRIDILTLPAIGDTRSIVDCYKVVAVIRWLAVWSATTFRRWMVDNALLSQ